MTLNVGAVGDRYEDMAANSRSRASAYEACIPQLQAAVFWIPCKTGAI
jgi:hypothetical protein